MRRGKTAFNQLISVTDLKQCTQFKEALNLAVTLNNTSYRELADALGYSYPQFQNIISGRQNIKPKICFEFERVLNIDAKYWWNLWWDSYCKK